MRIVLAGPLSPENELYRLFDDDSVNDRLATQQTRFATMFIMLLESYAVKAPGAIKRPPTMTLDASTFA